MENLVFAPFQHDYLSAFLALLTFTIAFVLLSQFAHNNSDYTRNRAIASQIMNQIEPFLAEAHTLSAKNNLLQARFSLVVIKKVLIFLMKA